MIRRIQMNIILVSISFAQDVHGLGNSQFGRKMTLKFKMIWKSLALHD